MADQQAIAAFSGPNAKYTVSVDPTSGKPRIVGFYVDPKTNKTTQNVVPYYLYVDKNGDWDIQQSIDVVIKKYTADLKATGTTNAAWQAMFNSGDITKKEFQTKDATAWYTGLTKYITSFGVNQVSSIASGASKGFTSFSKWFQSASGGAGSSTGTRKDTSTTTSGYQSTQAETDNEINLFFMEQLDRNATPEERKFYREQVNAEENKLKTTRTTTTTSTSTSGVSSSASKTGETIKTAGPGGLTKDDRTRIMSGILATAIKSTPTETLMKGGGAIAQSIADLRAYAGEYGLRNYTEDLAKSDLVTKLAGGASVSTSTLDAEKMAIRAMAKTFYPGLASLIDQGVRVSSIGSIYTNEMQKILELPAASIDWANDPYISKALQNRGMDGTAQGKEGALNLNDFAIMLRNDPRWSKTQNAREEAAGYANSILRSFGLAS